MSSQRLHLFAYSVFVLALVAGTKAHWVGDGGEYLAMALNLSERGRPWIHDSDIPQLQHEIVDRANQQDWDIVASTHLAADGTRDFVHFWLYSMLAAPLVNVSSVLGLSPLHGFTLLNAGLLLSAFFVAWSRLGSWLTWLLCAGPLIWWIDKAHTEVFTFVCLTVGLLLLREMPVLAMVALGAAATQNPPIVTLIPFAVAALVIERVPAVRSIRLWAGVAAGLALAATHVVYYYTRYGETSLLLRATRDERPSLREMLVVPLDLNLGLLPSFPAFGIALIVALTVILRRAPRRLFGANGLVTIAATAVFLVSFAKTANMHHAATPGMSRYGLWLIPLAMPWLAELHSLAGRGTRAVVAVVTVVSVVASTFVFHPARPDNYRQPTWIAHTVWTRYPNLSNPLPEIFVDSQMGRLTRGLPFATTRCEKVLLVGRGDVQGMWPMPCYPAEVPPHCREPGQYCYANRTGSEYRFVLEPNPVGTEFVYDRGRVWPQAVEPSIRRALTDLEWWRADAATRAPNAALDDEDSVISTTTYEVGDRFLAIILGPQENATITLRLDAPMTGTFVDAASGDVLGSAAFTGTPGERWQVAVPSGRDIVLLRLRKTLGQNQSE
jgi:hypothetical protein